MTRKAIFDAVRKAAPSGLFNDAGNVLALDNLLDDFGVPREQAAAALTVSPDGIALIKEFEGFSANAYPDPGTGNLPITIGYGSTTDEQGRPIARDAVWTRERAEARLSAHVAEFAHGVANLVSNKATQPQFDALVSFAYNVGTGALGKSTLLRLHRAGDYAGAASEFAKWVNAGGRVLPGLVRRRAAEAALYRRKS